MPYTLTTEQRDDIRRVVACVYSTWVGGLIVNGYSNEDITRHITAAPLATAISAGLLHQPDVAELAQKVRALILQELDSLRSAIAGPLQPAIKHVDAGGKVEDVVSDIASVVARKKGT